MCNSSLSSLKFIQFNFGFKKEYFDLKLAYARATFTEILI